MMTPTDEQILKERAMIIARSRVASSHHSTTDSLVVEFMLFPETYAVEAIFVGEVLTVKEICSIPGTPDYVMGVMNFRGKIISIINLKLLFGFKEQGLTEMNKALLIHNDHMEFGLIVDGISGSVNVNMNQLAAPPLTLSDRGAEFVSGLTTNGAILLDVTRMIESKLLKINQ